MGILARLYNFASKSGKTIVSAQVDQELNQLINGHNDHDANKVNKTDVIQKGAGMAYSPTATTDPANKGYVDLVVASAVLGVPPVGGIPPEMLSFNAADAGMTNASMDEIFSLFLPVDTRSLNPTAWDAEERATALEIRDGAIVLGTITITYNTDGKITQLVLTAGDKTVTYTQTWVGAKFTGRTKVVV